MSIEIPNYEVLQDSDFFNNLLFFSKNLLAKIVDEFLDSKAKKPVTSYYYSYFTLNYSKSLLKFPKIAGVDYYYVMIGFKLILAYFYYLNLKISFLLFWINESCFEEGSVM